MAVAAAAASGSGKEREPLLKGEPRSRYLKLSGLPKAPTTGVDVAIPLCTLDEHTFREAILSCVEATPEDDKDLAGGRVVNAYPANWFLGPAKGICDQFVGEDRGVLDLTASGTDDFPGFKASFHEAMRPTYMLLSKLFQCYAEACINPDGTAAPWLAEALVSKGITEENYAYKMLNNLIGTQLFFYSRYLALTKPEDRSIAYLSATYALFTAFANHPPTYPTFLGRLCCCFSSSDPLSVGWCEQAFENFLECKVSDWGGASNVMQVLPVVAAAPMAGSHDLANSLKPDDWIKFLFDARMRATSDPAVKARLIDLYALLRQGSGGHASQQSRSFHGGSAASGESRPGLPRSATAAGVMASSAGVAPAARSSLDGIGEHVEEDSSSDSDGVTP